MNISIDLSDAFLARVDKLAASLNISRDKLIERAPSFFVHSHELCETTRALNEIYATESSEIDSVMWEMQMASLTKEEW